MKVLLCLAGLVAATLATPTDWWNLMNMMQGNGGNGNGYGQGGNGYGYGSNNMGFGQTGNKYGGQMGNMQGGMRQGGYNNNNNNNNMGMLGIMLMHLLAQNMGNNNGMDYQKQGGKGDDSSSSSDDRDMPKGISEEHIAEFQRFMKHKMAQEMAESIYLQIKVKEAKKEFEKAMEGLCMYVHVTYEQMKHNNETTTAEFSDAEEEEWEAADEEEKGKMLWMLREQNPEKYGALGLMMGKHACYSGKAMDELLNKMEDKQECDSGKGDKSDGGEGGEGDDDKEGKD